MCQKQHGAMFATYASLPKSDLVYRLSLDSLMSYNSSSSIMRKFCKMCGSNIEWSGSKDYPDWVSVAISTLDTLYEPLFIEDIFNRSTESE